MRRLRRTGQAKARTLPSCLAPCCKASSMPRTTFHAMAPERRHVILTPVEDGWWMADVPSLPGCVTQGATKEEALENVKEAIQGVIESLRELGEAIPEDQDIESAVVVLGC